MRVLLKAGIEFDLALSNVVSPTPTHPAGIWVCVIAKEWIYDITGFIASLSFGSLAVALAAKDSLANVFGSLVIIIDKPFIIGDWISANRYRRYGRKNNLPQYLSAHLSAGVGLYS